VKVSDFPFGLTDANEKIVSGLVNLNGTPPMRTPESIATPIGTNALDGVGGMFNGERT
jgi:hypothetical protein